MRRQLIIRSLLTGASVLMISASGALAAKTPNILVSSTNQVPACVTPERLMEFVGWRNKKVAPTFNDAATYYQVHGNNLGIRWDYAFYQMLVETNYLKFRAPNGRMGDVRAHQNNFAGLGATGGGVPGETFKTVSDGVLAHLQHIQMYSGNRVANPIATRTRNIQDWDVILPWAQAFGREVNFTDLTTKWSPHDRGYSNDIEYTARKFRGRYCGGPNRIHTAQLPSQTRQPASSPSPSGGDVAFTASTISKAGTDLVALASREEKQAEQALAKARAKRIAAVKAAKAATKAARLRAEAAKIAAAKAVAAKAKAKKLAEQKLAEAAKAKIAMKIAEAKAAKDGTGSMALGARIPGNAGAAKCAVWTASYGGAKSLLIRSTKSGMVNYTALVVHEGQESREAAAYIKAWAKGGKAIGEFGTSDKALNRAYQLCPQS